MATIRNPQFVIRNQSMKKPRILILHASGGMGHVKAASAIAAAFAERHPEVVVSNINVLDFARPLFRFFYEDGYNFISAHLVRVWGWLYRRYNHPHRHSWLIGLTRWAMEEKLLSSIRQFAPDFIIGTHPMPTRLLANIGNGEIAAIPTAVVVTDYGCHSFWVDQRTTQYYVATNEVKACLGGYGVPPERIAVTGIPVDPKFSRRQDTEAIAREFGLLAGQPVVVIVGGLLDARYLEQLVAAVRQQLFGVQFLLVTGRDHQLRRQLERSALRQADGVHVFGFVQNMEALMAVADVVITKAGGLTVSECLAMGALLAIPSAIPGQEEDNLAFVLRHQVGVSAKAPSALARVIAPLLTDSALRDASKIRARSLGKPNAAYDLAADVLQKINAVRSTPAA